MTSNHIPLISAFKMTLRMTLTIDDDIQEDTQVFKRNLDENLEMDSKGDKLRSGKVQVRPRSGSVYRSNLVL